MTLTLSIFSSEMFCMIQSLLIYISMREFHEFRKIRLLKIALETLEKRVLMIHEINSMKRDKLRNKNENNKTKT